MLAHEIGHTLQLPHDSANNNTGCQCDEAAQCVMWPSGGHRDFGAVGWSNCAALLRKPAPKADTCLLNKPPFAAIASRKCGDLVVDRGEKCDCGPAYLCERQAAARCCNASTCQLRSAAYNCATGVCCNSSSCTFANSDAVCRPAYDECDLPEFCNGSASQCAPDTWKQDGSPCASFTGYCFRGRCKSLDARCKALVGPKAHVARLHSRPLCFRYSHCELLFNESLSADDKLRYKHKYDVNWDFACVFYKYVH